MSSDVVPRRSGAAALAVGSIVSGVLAYVFFAVVTRTLGATEAAPVAVLWAWWGFAAAGVTFPVQHWVARSVAADGAEGPVAAALPRVWALVLGVTIASGVAAWLLRDALFGSTGATFPVLVALVTALSGLMGQVRGLLVARDRVAAVATVLVAENALRCLAAAALVAVDARAPEAYGGALLVGYAACLLWPSTWLPRGSSVARPAVGFLTGAAGGQLVGQAVLTGGPVVLALAGGAPSEVTALFAGLALFRAPYTLAVGQVSTLTARVTDLVVAGRVDAVRRLHGVVVATALVGAPVAAAVGALAGPPLLRLVFGSDAALDPGPAAVVAAGTTFAIAGLVLTVLVMAKDRAPWIAAAWAVALLPGVAAYIVVDGGLESVVAAFLAVEVVAWAGLALASRPAAAGVPA